MSDKKFNSDITRHLLRHRLMIIYRSSNKYEFIIFTTDLLFLIVKSTKAKFFDMLQTTLPIKGKS